jgi:SAM-dependent methyltransferase
MPQPQRHSLYFGQLLAHHFRDQATIRGAEIGVFRGENAAYLLGTLPTLRLWLVDAWSPSPYEQDRNRFHSMASGGPDRFTVWESQAQRAVAFAVDRYVVVKQDFRVAAGLVPSQLDFVFLDAAHSYEDTRDQIAVWARKVRPGGIVAGHDYGYPQPGFEGVKAAVDLAAFDRCKTLEINPPSYVWHWVN